MSEAIRENKIPKPFLGLFSKEKINLFVESLLFEAKIGTYAEDNKEEFLTIENVNSAAKYLEQIAGLNYFSQGNILETAIQYYATSCSNRELQKLLVLKIKDLDPNENILTSFDSKEISTSKLCKPVIEKLHTSFLAQNIDSFIIFKDQFPDFVNTFHYQICVFHPSLGYFLVDPTWQQMLRPNSRKPDNPNILILHIKYPNQNLEIDRISQKLVEYNMENSIIEQYFLNPIKQLSWKI